MIRRGVGGDDRQRHAPNADEERTWLYGAGVVSIERPWDTREVTEVERQQGQVVDDRRRRDDQVMGADALAGGSQLIRNPSMPPGNLLIERENPYKRYQPVEVLLPTRLPSWIIGPVYSDEEFGECDRPIAIPSPPNRSRSSTMATRRRSRSIATLESIR